MNLDFFQRTYMNIYANISFAGVLKTREMCDFPQYLAKDGFELLSVEQIAVVERHFLPGYLLDPLERRGLAVGLCHAVCKVVYSHHVVSALQKLDDAMTADVAGASGHENRPPISRHLPETRIIVQSSGFSARHLRFVSSLLRANVKYCTHFEINVSFLKQLSKVYGSDSSMEKHYSCKPTNAGALGAFTFVQVSDESSRSPKHVVNHWQCETQCCTV